MNNNPEKNKKKKGDLSPSLRPDPETLHTTDPQEHMKGPLSSSVQKTKETVEKNDEQSKNEAENKKEKNM